VSALVLNRQFLSQSSPCHVIVLLLLLINSTIEWFKEIASRIMLFFLLSMFSTMSLKHDTESTQKVES